MIAGRMQGRVLYVLGASRILGRFETLESHLLGKSYDTASEPAFPGYRQGCSGARPGRQLGGRACLIRGNTEEAPLTDRSPRGDGHGTRRFRVRNVPEQVS